MKQEDTLLIRIISTILIICLSIIHEFNIIIYQCIDILVITLRRKKLFRNVISINLVHQRIDTEQI